MSHAHATARDTLDHLGNHVGPTRRLAEFVAGLRWSDVDPFAQRAARRHLIDSCAGLLAGAPQEVTRMVGRMLDAAAGSQGAVPVPGQQKRRDLLSAAYLAGTAAHGLELDDGARAGSVHPGSVIVPSVLTLAHWLGADCEAMLRALVAGYEVCFRVAAAGHPRTRLRQFHNTGIVGPIGVAAAAASLMGFNADQVENAFGIAASSSAGLFSFLAGGDVKRIHPGHAAREGLQAALLTREGMAGSPEVLEQKAGWFAAFAGDAKAGGEDIMEAGDFHPQSRFAVANCYMKPHACCRHIHAAIDGVLEIAEDEKIDPAKVARIDIGTYAVAAEHAHVGWSEMTTAQMSFPFVIATALARGQVSLHDFDDGARADPKVLDLTGRVHAFADPECDAAYPGATSARVSLVTVDGKKYERFVAEPFGASTRPLEDPGLDRKFLNLAEPVLGAGRAGEALALLRGFALDQSAAKIAEALAL